MKGLLTAKEAQKILGVTDDKFQYMIRTGLVKKVILPGRKYGLYAEPEINRLAAAINATIEQYTRDVSEFEVATQADLPEIYAMVARNMPRVTPIEKQRAWLRRNPESFYTLRENGIVVAYVCIFPINYQWLRRVLKDEIRMGDVPTEEIYPFIPDEPLDIYIRDMIVDQQPGAEKAKHYGQRLLTELINVITKLGARGINIRAFYGLATSPDGNRLAKKLGFRAMTELDNTTEGYMPYELLVKNSDSSLIEGYKKELQYYLDQKKVDSRTDSRTREIPLTMTNASEQNHAKRASPRRSKQTSTGPKSDVI